MTTNDWIDALLNRYPAVGMALGVIREGELELFRGHGVANVDSATPITVDTVFRIASITKTFTAIAVMQLRERGLLDLDAPANRYLRGFQLVPARRGFRDATVRHLLTHTSGIPELVRPLRAIRYFYGESWALDERVPSLAEFYRGGLRLVSDPGTVFRYTDHNFAVAGQIVEDVTGEPFDCYLRANVFEPLGMDSTDINRSEAVKAHLATGYTIGARGPKPVEDRRWLTAAASMIYSSPRDMALYVAALLGGGANKHGRVLQPHTLAEMFAPQYRPEPRVPGIGLAFDRADLGGHEVVGHEGVLPGFNSQIYAAVDDGIGVMAFTNGARGAMLWLPAEMADFLGHLVGAPPRTVRTDVPQHPEIWPAICGWYPLEAPLTDTRLRVMLGAGVRVSIRHGRPWIRIMSPLPVAFRGFELHPDDARDPYVFRIDGSRLGLGTARLVFAPHDKGMRVSLDVMPISLEKRGPDHRPLRMRTIGTGRPAGAA